MGSDSVDLVGQVLGSGPHVVGWPSHAFPMPTFPASPFYLSPFPLTPSLAPALYAHTLTMTMTDNKNLGSVGLPCLPHPALPTAACLAPAPFPQPPSPLPNLLPRPCPCPLQRPYLTFSPQPSLPSFPTASLATPNLLLASLLPPSGSWILLVYGQTYIIVLDSSCLGSQPQLPPYPRFWLVLFVVDLGRTVWLFVALYLPNPTASPAPAFTWQPSWLVGSGFLYLLWTALPSPIALPSSSCGSALQPPVPFLPNSSFPAFLPHLPYSLV